jgi:hypothetical protein
MNYEDWKRTLVVRSAALGAAFFVGMLVEAFRNYSAWGVLLVAFFFCALGAGLVMLVDAWLERWYEHSQNQRGEWAEF